MENSEILNTVMKSLPYADQIRDVDMSSENSVIRFRWRSHEFRVSGSLHVETIQNDCLHGCDLAIVMRQMLKQAELLSA